MAETRPGLSHYEAENLEKMSEDLQALKSKVASLSSLIEISIIINSALDLDSLVALVMEKAQAVMNAEASSVMLVNEELNVLECQVALGEVGDQIKTIRLKMGEGIAGWVAEEGEALIVPDVSLDPRFSSKSDSSTGFQTRSIIAAPLMVKERIIGVAEVINRNDGRAFDDDDLELFSTFCRQVAMAIENAKMYELKLEKQRYEQELEAARTIQQSFMPEISPFDPTLRYSISAESIAAKSVGGDFFDFIDFRDGKVGIAVGDVTGKGVPAALYMARLVSDFRRFIPIHRDPAEVLKALNELLVERSRRGMFVTLQYGILDVSSGEFIYANAGHLPFLKVGPKGKKVEMLAGGKTIPLGIAPGIPLESASARLERGGAVVSITDGIMEAKNKAGEIYSLKRVVELLQKKREDAGRLVFDLLADVSAYSQGTDQHDDLTILALKWI
jgi:sigma-B regulation protein RsbU (phosphoserine phosphatase)